MKVESLSVKSGLTTSTIKKIHSVFEKHSGIKTVCLFGSRAKGTYRTGSDIDLVIMDNSLAKGEILAIETELDDLLLPYQIDLLIYEQLENQALTEHILRVDQCFYTR